MQRIEKHIKDLVVQAARQHWDVQVDEAQVQVQKTRRDFEGDFTLVVFPLLRFSKKGPEQTADFLGTFLMQSSGLIDSFNVIKGFLNLRISQVYWKELLAGALRSDSYGKTAPAADAPVVMIEYSSPNTNKPLHLGHIRNNLLGHAVS